MTCRKRIMREDCSCGKLHIKALGLRKLVISLHSEYQCFYTSLVNFSTFVYFPARVGVNAQIIQPNYSETNRVKSHKVKYKTSPAVTRCISETLGWKCKWDAKYQHFHRFVNFCYARVKKRVSICCNVVATLKPQLFIFLSVTTETNKTGRFVECKY